MPEQEFITTDPAARLIEILQRAMKAVGRPFLDFWAEGFRIEATNVTAIHYNLGLLHRLVDDVERAVKRIPDLRHEQYLKPLSSLRTIIAQPNLQAAWQGHSGSLAVTINGLEYVSERLQASSPEPDLSPSELQSLRQQTNDLIQKLAASKTIPKSLRLILYDLLNAVVRSIDEYQFRGIRGLREELFVIAARIQEHLPEFETAKNEPEVKSFFALLKKIDTVTAAALHVKELISTVAPLLPLIPALLEHLPR